MARIRTIKSEIWSDEKFVELTPMARLLFIGLWNFADREGRMVYSPKRIKMQIFPGDDVDVIPLIDELKTLGMVTIYACSNARILSIPSFSKHQHINSKETPSLLPASGVVTTLTESAVLDGYEYPPSTLPTPIQHHMEGKGREGKVREGEEQHLTSAAAPVETKHTPATKAQKPSQAPNGMRIAGDWWPSEALRGEVRLLAPDRGGGWFKAETEKFRDYWIGIPGHRGRKVDWPATYRNWIRKANADGERGHGTRPSKPQERINSNRAAICEGLGLEIVPSREIGHGQSDLQGTVDSGSDSGVGTAIITLPSNDD